MKIWFFIVLSALGTPGHADLSCTLTPALSDAPTTLLIRDTEPNDEAVILVSGRTLVFECPSFTGTNAMECYGETQPPMNAPTQLNIAAEQIEAGTVVVVTTRNLLFGKNEHIGYHRRHASVHVYAVAACEEF